jgi:hypothetical protein
VLPLDCSWHVQQQVTRTPSKRYGVHSNAAAIFTTYCYTWGEMNRGW